MKKIFTFFAALACVMSMSAVTYNVTVPAGTNACYIAGEMTGWGQQEMTKVDDTHYTLDIADATEAMKYKYCSGPGWAYVEKTAAGDEVGDRTYTPNDVVEAWAAVYDPNNVPSQGETKDITVKAKVPAEWTDQITAWVWPTGGEGKEVTPTKEGEWYIYTQNCAELNIIFKNGAGWNGDPNQTVDITVTESTCIEIKAGSGKATYTVIDCEGGENPGDTTVTPEPEPEPNPGETKTIYLNTGGAQLWNQADAKFFVHAWGEGATDLDAQMTLVEGDVYQVEIANAHTSIIFLRLAPTATGVVWEGNDLWNKTVDLTIPAESNCYTITGWEPEAGTWSSYTPGDTPVDPNPGDDPVVTPTAYYITGNEALFGADQWKADAIAMTEAEGVYTHTFTAVAAGVECQFKVTNGTWDQSWGFNDVLDAPAGVTGNAEGNVVFTLAEAGDVVVTFNGTNITVTGNFAQGGDTPVDPNPGETKDITVKAKVPATWTDQITAWVWPTGGDGQEVIPAQEGEWYVYTQNCTELNIIFKNGAGWNGDANQTVDITVTESTCIEITSDGASKATYTVAECPGTDVENVTTKDIPALDLAKPMYNVLGQEVDANYHGIILQNGFKYLH